MQNIISLPNAQECCHYIRENLLQTEMLRQSFDEGGLVAKIVRQFSRRPRFFYEPSPEFMEIKDPAGIVHREFVEAPHFSPWWGGVQLRTYENKLVQDLYYLHEICHAATMPYGPDISHACTDPITFKNKIRDNEHEASTLSEMTIYLEFPQLRAMSFQHEIFVDRFLFPTGDRLHVNAKMIQRWREEPEIVEKELKYARAAVLTGVDPDESDLAAFWLKRFYSQGKAWTSIWTNPRSEFADIPLGGRFREVELAMVRFRDECHTHGRSAALERHLAWLQSETIAHGTGIPFYPEAKAFCESYLGHKVLYFQSLQRHGQTTEIHKK